VSDPRRSLAIALLIIGSAIAAWGAYLPAKAALAQILLERAWMRVQKGEVSARPWPWADMTPLAEIEIPRLRQRVIVLEGASGEAMAFGPGHMPNTPGIGAPGTSIVAAHRDTQFSSLGALRPGDEIVATSRNGRRTTFRVSATHVVRANVSGLDPAYGGPAGARLALVTCYPFEGVLHSPLRYVVIADKYPAENPR